MLYLFKFKEEDALAQLVISLPLENSAPETSRGQVRTPGSETPSPSPKQQLTKKSGGRIRNFFLFI